jgi:hypothetical protein
MWKLRNEIERKFGLYKILISALKSPISANLDL